MKTLVTCVMLVMLYSWRMEDEEYVMDWTDEQLG